MAVSANSGRAAVAERGKAGAGRKFSITIQVPEEVGAGWPDRATAERLVNEVYQAMGGQAPAARPARRSRAAAVVAAFAVGAAVGYLGAASFPSLRSPGTGAPGQAPAPSVAEQPAPSEAVSSPPAAASGQAESAVQPATPAPTEPPAPSPAPAPTAPLPAGEYRVQVGAFRQRENATAQAARLARDGFVAEIRRSGILYVVLVGPPRPRADADRLAARLRERGYDALVIRAP